VISGGKSASVSNFSADGKGGFTQTASQTAFAMAARQVEADIGVSPPSRNMLMGTPGWFSAWDPNGTSRVYDSELSRAARGVNIEPDVVHEFGYHHSREELNGGLSGPSDRLGTVDAQTHQQAYRASACRQLGGC